MLNGGLFTRDFLIEGITDELAWKELDDSILADLRNRLDALFASFGKLKTPTEAETEKDLIWPLLEALGWLDMLVQQNLSVKRREDVPDALLFPNSEAKQNAMPLTAWQRFQHGVCVVEAKRWNRPLDRVDVAQKGEDGVPSTQMLRYLRRVDDITNGGLRWGILTNGRHWRLYFRGALSALHRHMKKFEEVLDPKTGKLRGLRHREDQGRVWWELRPCAYYAGFADPKICYQVIQYHPQFSLDIMGSLSNDKTFFVANADLWLIASLNSPLLWCSTGVTWCTLKMKHLIRSRSLWNLSRLQMLLTRMPTPGMLKSYSLSKPSCMELSASLPTGTATA